MELARKEMKPKKIKEPPDGRWHRFKDTRSGFLSEVKQELGYLKLCIASAFRNASLLGLIAIAGCNDWQQWDLDKVPADSSIEKTEDLSTTDIGEKKIDGSYFDGESPNELGVNDGTEDLADMQTPLDRGIGEALDSNMPDSVTPDITMQAKDSGFVDLVIPLMPDSAERDLTTIHDLKQVPPDLAVVGFCREITINNAFPAGYVHRLVLSAGNPVNFDQGHITIGPKSMTGIIYEGTCNDNPGNALPVSLERPIDKTQIVLRVRTANANAKKISFRYYPQMNAPFNTTFGPKKVFDYYNDFSNAGDWRAVGDYQPCVYNMASGVANCPQRSMWLLEKNKYPMKARDFRGLIIETLVDTSGGGQGAVGMFVGTSTDWTAHESVVTYNLKPVYFTCVSKLLTTNTKGERPKSLHIAGAGIISDTLANGIAYGWPNDNGGVVIETTSNIPNSNSDMFPVIGDTNLGSAAYHWVGVRKIIKPEPTNSVEQEK